MRLIDADALERIIKNEYCIVINGQLAIRTEDGGLKPLLPEMPTAYDVEAVQECEDKTDYANIELYAFWQKHQWIPCSERLPEEFIGVIITAIAMNGAYYTEIGKWNGNQWFHGASNTRIDMAEVIAWQPLPEPYKEETK